MYARSRKKPLWKLVVDFTPEVLVRSTAWQYITDVITREQALAMLKAKDATKKDREGKVRELGYLAYITSAGWLGYSDEKVACLTKEAVAAGFNHFDMKVGADQASDLRRGKIIRSIIDDPQYLPANATPRDPESEQIKGKNIWKGLYAFRRLRIT
ncbi:hypothetical protein BDZ89DRAFT_1256711 [Hymenopellis radicata]|nr:hypothetical protein BDZ89DRAFT_1256711 [Hymenopellis radicata]